MHEAYRITNRTFWSTVAGTEVLEVTAGELKFALDSDDAPLTGEGRMGQMGRSHDDDEIETAVLDAIRFANANDTYPTVDELSATLIHRALAANDVAAAADRLYRSNRISANAAGGLRARD